MALTVGGSILTFGGLPVSMIAPMPRVSTAGKNFMRNGQPYKFWGWHTQVPSAVDFLDPSIQEPFRVDVVQKAKIKSNVLRIFLEMFNFISGPNTAGLVFNQTAMANLVSWLDVARDNNTYVKLCAGNVWVPSAAPPWYDAFTNFEDRWDVQEFYFTELVKGIVAAGHDSTIMGYDLAGEPVVKLDPAYPWYGEESYPGIADVSGLYLNPCVARGPLATNQAARNWIKQLTSAIKRVDPQALCTVGTLPFVGGAFGRDNTQDLLDFVSPHIYPFDGVDLSGDTSFDQVQGWAEATVPAVCGEYYSLSTIEINETTLQEISETFNGIISWGSGKDPETFILDPALDFFSQIQIAFEKYNTEVFILMRDDFIGGNV